MKEQNVSLTPAQKKRVEYYKTVAEIIEIKEAEPGQIPPFDRIVRVFIRRNISTRFKNQMIEIGVRGGILSKTKYDEDWNVMYWVDDSGCHRRSINE